MISATYISQYQVCPRSNENALQLLVGLLHLWLLEAINNINLNVFLIKLLGSHKVQGRGTFGMASNIQLHSKLLP